jgi:hypothetical protein
MNASRWLPDRSKISPLAHAPTAAPMPVPMEMTPRIAPAALEEIGGLGGDQRARAPQVRPRKQACTHSSHV